MKKLVVILAALMVIASTGCGSDSTKTQALTYVARPTSTYNPQVFTLDPTTQKSTAVNIPVPANAMSVSANSDASLLVYTHNDTSGKGTDVYLMGTAGTETQLTTGADANSPVFSPDGKTIAYVGVPSGGGDWQVFTMKADGSNQTALCAPPVGTLSQYVPTFSPDSKSLVFYIYVYNAPGAATSHSHPTAQGQSLLPARNVSTKTAARGVHPQAVSITQSGWYTMALTDTTPTLVYATNNWWGPAVYSTDGTKLLFTDYDGNDWNIFSVNLDGTGVTELTTETTTESLAPVPYKGAILFNRWNSTNSSYDIYVMDPTGANQLLVNSMASTYEFLTDSYWSND